MCCFRGSDNSNFCQRRIPRKGKGYALPKLSRVKVETKEDPRCPVGVYDVMTVGAFTAFNRGFKNGGLRRLVLSQKDAASDPAMATAPTDTNKLDHIR